jgi:RNA 3'-terminal phosphate cyclase-like protein
MGNRMVDKARSILNNFIPDVYIYTDHYKGKDSGLSPGYAISLVAETTTGCLISAEFAAHTNTSDPSLHQAAAAASAPTISLTSNSNTSSSGDSKEITDTSSTVNGAIVLPEDLGIHCSKLLVEEIAKGGVVDSAHQSLVLLLMLLCPEDVSKIRLGKLAPHAYVTAS